jgi:hypothetical protein
MARMPRRAFPVSIAVSIAALAWLAASGTAIAQSAPSDTAAPKPPDDAALRKAWGFLTEAEQDDALARFEAEAPLLGTFQCKLLHYALSLEERDRSFLPKLADAPFYDPAVHAPAQPIARHRLAPDSSDAVDEHRRIFAKVPERKLRETWRYDWAAGEVVHCPPKDSREAAFENALAGMAPDLDLAEALVERALDGGAQRRELAAFGHAYTDRSGHVYPGITLYDAWASGTDMEMPDVDVLGIVHELRDEWKKWVAPVAPDLQDDLYKTVGEIFVAALRYRGLRTALARTYLSGTVELRDGYALHIERLHALWDAHASTPGEVAALLPDSEHWAEFLEKWTLQCEEHPDVLHAGVARHAQLDRDAAATRAFFAEILKDLGALERTSKPPPRATKQR